MIDWTGAPWAFTKLKAFETCLRQGSSRYITREYPFQETPAMVQGRDFHTMLEDVVNHGAAFPKDFEWLYEFVPTRVDGNVLLAELGLGITEDGEPCEFSDKEAWFRGKLDILTLEGDLCLIGDWKTGKRYEDPDELQLHSVLAKAHFPDAKHWRGIYAWLKVRTMGTMHTLSPSKSLDRLRERVKRVEDAIMAGNQDIPRKNALCPWCALERCQYFSGGNGR